MNKPTKIILIALMLALILTACTTGSPEPADQPPAISLPTATETPAVTPTPTLKPPPEQRMDEGDRAIFMGHYEHALEIFQDTLTTTTDPSVRDRSNLGIGQAYVLMGEPGQSLNVLRQAANSDDERLASRAIYILAQAFNQLQRYDEALATYQTYLEISPGLIDERIHERIGDLYRILAIMVRLSVPMRKQLI
jgi:tetratricopeptide (TPR) repeat protein